MPSDRRPLRDLALALLNATLMLGVAVLILIVVLVVQLRGLANDLQSATQHRIDTLQPQIEAARAEARAALEAFQAAHPVAPGAISPSPSPQLTEMRALVERLESLPPVIETEAPMLRQLALAIIATAARNLLTPEP